MTDRSTRDAQYVLVRDSKPKKTTRYYYDPDDDYDSQQGATTRRIVQTKPPKEQRARYVLTTDERPRVAESNDRRIKIRSTTSGEQVVLDENNNVLKIIRSSRSPSPTIIENQRLKIRPRESRTLYYQTSDGHLVARSSMNPSLVRPKNDFVYAENEPTKLLRKVIVDPQTGERETIYEKEKPKKQVQQKYIIQKRSVEIPVDAENNYEQQPQYVQVVQRRAVQKQEPPSPPTTTKYVMIRKKVDNEPIYSVPSSSVPAPKTVRRIVYESPTKKTPPTYVYETDGKYYK